MTKTAIVNVLVTDETCPKPKTAYSGTSAAIDIAATDTVIIKPGEHKTVPVGYRLSIDESAPFYMQVHLRSSFGFKRGIRCHIGIIDAGYTGDFGVSVVNNTCEEVIIKKHEYFAQVLILEKPRVYINYLSDAEWDVYGTLQERGTGGFGSSNNL